MKIYPKNGRIVVKPVEPAEDTKEGIIIPDTAQEKPREGKVIAIAEDATEEVAEGDRVIYKEFGGTELKMDEEDLIILTSEDLVAKYEEKDKIPE